MKDWIYGFFMAWGMFLAIPCPLKIWNEKARSKMICCLPLVGLVVGGVWLLAAYVGRFLPQSVAGLLIAAAPWLATGFLHLDGFMDVCDAVLTLRPMTTSQYAAMTGRKTPYVVFAALVMAAAIIVPLALWGSFAPLAAAVGYWLAVWYADRQLGGMSGDVSGFALTLGELWGLAVLTLVR